KDRFESRESCAVDPGFDRQAIVSADVEGRTGWNADSVTISVKEHRLSYQPIGERGVTDNYAAGTKYAVNRVAVEWPPTDQTVGRLRACRRGINRERRIGTRD